MRACKQVKRHGKQTSKQTFVFNPSNQGEHQESVFFLFVYIRSVCEEYNLFPFYLGAYTTKVYMDLDQHPNREADRLWQEGRRDNPEGSSVFKSLELANRVHDASYGVP